MVIVSNKLKTSCDNENQFLKDTEFSAVNFNQAMYEPLTDFLFRNITINENNFDQLFIKFYSLIAQTIDKYAPMKKLSKKQKRLLRRPWITKEILISIKRKQRMHKTHYIKGSTLSRYLIKNIGICLQELKH